MRVQWTGSPHGSRSPGEGTRGVRGDCGPGQVSEGGGTGSAGWMATKSCSPARSLGSGQDGEASVALWHLQGRSTFSSSEQVREVSTSIPCSEELTEAQRGRPCLSRPARRRGPDRTRSPCVRRSGHLGSCGSRPRCSPAARCRRTGWCSTCGTAGSSGRRGSGCRSPGG